MSTLTHFTWDTEKLVSILNYGFVFVPNSRKLLSELIGSSDEIEEPCRGMVCFTDLTLEEAQHRLTDFGRYGIRVSMAWAKRHGARRVRYVGQSENSDEFNKLKTMFRSAIPKIEFQGNESLQNWLSGLVANRPEFAKSLGGKGYADLLSEYEYFQTDENWSESEWRIMRKHKFSATKGMDREDLKDVIIKSTRAGIIPSLKIVPSDVEALVCPLSNLEEFESYLPEQWKSTDIIPI